MLFLRGILCLGVLVFLGACERGSVSGIESSEFPVQVPPEQGPSTVSTEVQAQDVFALTNEYRKSNGLLELSWSPVLAEAAQDYAARMADEGFFSHTAPDGTTLAERLSAAGFSGWTFGENIAYGYGTPAQVMSGWIASSGHRANILGRSYREIGVGFALSKSGTAYWVQDFGAAQ